MATSRELSPNPKVPLALRDIAMTCFTPICLVLVNTLDTVLVVVVGGEEANKREEESEEGKVTYMYCMYIHVHIVCGMEKEL